MKFGKRNIMSTLQQQQVFLKFDKYSTHREAYIDWFKYIGTTLTLQASAKLRVENLLKTAHLIPSEIASLTTTNHKTITDTFTDHSRKRTSKVNHDAEDE